MLTRLRNKFLFWYYRKEIVQLIAAFYDKNEKPRIIEAIELNKIVKDWGWSNDKAQRVHFLCTYFGFIQQCNHPLFKKRIAYKLSNSVK